MPFPYEALGVADEENPSGGQGLGKLPELEVVAVAQNQAPGHRIPHGADADLQGAAVGDLIRVRNTDSGIIVQGTVMQDGTIQVVAK